MKEYEIMKREQLILKMLEASRKPCPDVVPAIRMQHKVTGQRHSIFGMPFGFKSDDYTSVTVGYVFRDKNGTTYGTACSTPEECYTRHAEWENHKADDFRKELESMTDERFQAQVNYWLKETVNA
jgi:hypothetical protein